MPRRNNRVPFEPLDLSPDRIQLGHAPSPIRGRLITREEADCRERERVTRQRNARINGGIDWEVCIVPGCGEDLHRWGNWHNPPGQRDHTLELPLCVTHLCLAAFGLELDVSFGVAGAEAEDPAAALNGGTTQGYFMAPVARPEMPDEIPGVDRNNGWGDEDRG